MTNPRDDWDSDDSMSGLNLFDDTASAAGNFPHALRGYDRQSVDSYVREVEQKATELKVQLRERNRDLTHVRVETGTTDFTRLGAHAKQLLQAAEAQAAQLVRQGATEAERIRNEGRRSAAAMRESAQREIEDVRLSGLSGLRRLRQEQAEAGEAALASARGDAELIRSEAEAAAQHFVADATARANALLERATAESAAHLSATETAATQTLLAAQQDAETTLAEALESASTTQDSIAHQLATARENQERSTDQLLVAREEAAKVRAQAVAAAEQVRMVATRDAEETMEGMRSRLREDETRLEEQLAWRKEQLEREIAALSARRSFMVAAMQNLKGIADEAEPGPESEAEETTVIPWPDEDIDGNVQ